MSRKPVTAAVADTTEVLSSTLPEDAASLAVHRSAVESYADARDAINQLLGQIQMAEAMTQFSRTVRTSKLAHIKESKAYRSLAGRKTPDGTEFSGTWEEFCSLLHRSADQVDEDIRNFRVFADDAYEAMTNAGIGYREMRQLRKLPEDEREALVEVAKQGNSDALVEIAESLIAKHTVEKAKLTKVAEKASEQVEQQAEKIAQQQEVIDNLKDERKRLRREWAGKPPEQRTKDLRDAVRRKLDEVLTEIGTNPDEPTGLGAAVHALLEDEVAGQEDHTEFLAGLYAEAIVTLRKQRDNLVVVVPIREAAE